MTTIYRIEDHPPLVPALDGLPPWPLLAAGQQFVAPIKDPPEVFSIDPPLLVALRCLSTA